MPNIRRRLIQARAALTPQLRLYLERGDYTGGPDHHADVDVWRLAAGVLRGNVAALAAVWQEHREEVLATWPYRRKRPWAARRLGPLAADAPRPNGHHPHDHARALKEDER